MKLYSMNGYVEAGQELQEKFDLRDRCEERGYSTSTLDRQIDELIEARSEFKQTHKEECEKDF